MWIISGEGRISVFPEAPGVETSRYRAVFSFQAPYLHLAALAAAALAVSWVTLTLAKR